MKKSKNDSPIAAYRAHRGNDSIGWIDGEPPNGSLLQSLDYTIEFAYKHANHTDVPVVNRDAESALLEAACELRKAMRAAESKCTEKRRSNLRAAAAELDAVLDKLYHRFTYPTPDGE